MDTHQLSLFPGGPHDPATIVSVVAPLSAAAWLVAEFVPDSPAVGLRSRATACELRRDGVAERMASSAPWQLVSTVITVRDR